MYQLIRQDPGQQARLGKVRTRHGDFDTPAFMPVGTQGSVKGLLPDQLAAAGTQIILANTYHLMLRPGEKTVAALGGLHRFMAWPGPILTDSGGFQAFSLSDINSIDDDGITFKSHIDGSQVRLDPSRSIAVQNDLDADIIMAFDHCPPAGAAPDEHDRAARRTVHWARQCLLAHQRPCDQALFAIVQGGTDPPLRQWCLEQLLAMDFAGYALGGLAVGESFQAMNGILARFGPLLPANKPRYLMGVGFPRDIVAAVAAGFDMFDCVLPTRNGRNAYAFAAQGPLRLRNSVYQQDRRPIEDGCGCYCCRHFSRGAIRHFFFAGEILGPVLVSVHNVCFYQRLMADIRQAVAAGRLPQFVQADPRCRLAPGGASPDANCRDRPAGNASVE